MAIFAPNGLTPIFSNSNSAVAQPGLFELPYGSQYFHGFAGDVICQNFFPGTPGNVGDTQAPLGFCYPYPVNFSGNEGTATQINWCPILGVAVGFRYQPLGRNGEWIESTNWIAGTPIVPNSTVYVQIQPDIQNIFRIQISEDESTGIPPTLTQNYLFYNTWLTSQQTYTVTLPELTSGTANPVNQLQFGLGDMNPNGRSKTSLFIRDINNESFHPVEATPFVIMGVTNGSRWTDTFLKYSETHQWVTCRINWAWAQQSLMRT